MEIGINDVSRSAPQAAPSGQLGKNEFVKLLIAQLRNQDPTSPTDSQAFVAQLAQFASVEQLQGMGDKLDGILLAQASANQTAIASLVGREILYRTTSVGLKAEGPATLHGELSRKAQSVTVTISDSDGKVVRTVHLGAHEAGAFEYGWDGLDDKGMRLPPGDYEVRLAAADENGNNVPMQSRSRAIATGVSFENGYPELIVAGKRIKLSDIVEIKQ